MTKFRKVPRTSSKLKRSTKPNYNEDDTTRHCNQTPSSMTRKRVLAMTSNTEMPVPLSYVNIEIGMIDPLVVWETPCTVMIHSEHLKRQVDSSAIVCRVDDVSSVEFTRFCPQNPCTRMKLFSQQLPSGSMYLR